MSYTGIWKSQIYNSVSGTFDITVEHEETNANAKATLTLMYNDGKTKVIVMEGSYKDENRAMRLSAPTHTRESFVLRQKDLSHSQYFVLKFNVSGKVHGGYLTCIYPADYVILGTI